MMARGNTGFRIKKIVGWTGLILALLGAVSGMAWYYAQSKDFFFSEIKNMTRQMAGYELSKSDPLSFTLFPRPTLTVKNLEVSNPGLNQHALIVAVGEMSVMLSWSALFRLELDLDVVVTAPQMSLDIDTGGARNWMTPELEEVTGDLPFDLGKIDTTELGLMFRNHQSNEVLGLDIHQFDINLRDGGGSARVETAGRVGKSRFFLLGEVIQQGEDNRFTVDLDFGAGRARETRVDAIRAPSVSWWIRQNAVLFPLQGAVKGEFELQQQLPWGELSVELATANLDEFLHLSDEYLALKSSIGPLRASGRVVLRGSDVDVKELDTRIDQSEISINLKGDVSNLLSIVETDLLLGARSSDLNSLVDTGTLIPVIGTRLADSPLETAIDATIRSKGKQFLLEDGAVMLKQGSLSAQLGGGLSVQDNTLEYEAELQAEAPDFFDLTRILDIEQPANSGNDSMKITATLAGSEDRISVKDARIDFQEGNYKLETSGTIDLTGESPVLDLHCQLDVLDAVAVKTYLSILPDPLLQELSVALRVDVKGPAGDFELRKIELEMVHDRKKLVGTGTVSGLPENPEVTVDIHYNLQGALELDQYFPALGPQRLMGPLDLNGTVTYSDQRLVIEQLELIAEQTDVGGLIDMDFSKSPTQIVVLMDARDFKTGLVTAEPGTEEKNDPGPAQKEEPEAEEAKSAQVPASKPDKSPGELFREFTNGIEIQTSWVNDLDFYLSFTADHAILGKYDIEALDLIIDARNGVFTVANYEVTLQGRPMRLSGYINVNTDPPTYLFAGSIEGETLEALLNLEEQIFEGGELSGEFVFLSEGNTLGEFIRHLAGQALVEMGPVAIRSRALDLVSSDILHSMLGGITRSKEEKKSTRYKCGVLGVDVNRGIARINKSFTLEAKDYNLAGKGKIDLNTGYVELAARPKAKKGLGISLSSVIGGFKVEGHIATPKFGLGGGGLVSAAILGYALTPTMAAAAANPVTATIVATGFFAKGIFDRMTASSYSCKKTVERFERNRRREINPRRPQSGKMDI